MGLVTKDEVKTLLRIDNTNYDAFITAVIPLLILSIVEDCNNNFTTRVEYEGTDISFIVAPGVWDPFPAILSADSAFGDFKITFYIYISGSLYNDGFQYIYSASSSVLKILSNTFSDIISEDAGETVKISRVVFPDRLKLIIANMIQWQIKKFANFEKYDANDKSFSVTIDDYPASIRNALSSYRRIELL